MPSFFKWNEIFLTGLPSVDEQHQRLVALINDVGELAVAHEAPEPQAFAAARQRLIEYVAVHFRDEESQMQQAGVDPRHLVPHQHEHRVFAEEVSSFGRGPGGFDSAQARSLVDYLVYWLAYHILGVDQSMARQVRAMRDGRSAAQAFEIEAAQRRAGQEPLLAALSGLFQTVLERNRELRRLNSELNQRVRDRTADLERANEQLRIMALRDELTGLPNRRHALAALDELWAEAQRDSTALSVLMLDADRFKQVNDQFGHAVGDDLLRALAVRLRDAVRTSDLVCRLGGDEFLVICPRTARAGAVAVADKILASRSSLTTAAGAEYWSGAVSIGVAEAHAPMNRPEELLKLADDALYAAKRLGGARIGG